ncbi:hypothetical protein G6L37_34455 [Agrobacterium rubi]|uniref:hypothetical protein n=1 Tax=Agrobacterium rubi TaxID=28099 RepID=UPI001572ED8C|nr:hypothetical protein [Agrobacterium rubi]NTF11101.1 hypothetical protein [Agrobacterium rubi]NTF23475.1 hypothetical protein [Agrobacterium rubi]NTF30412.1 hypothetical protein [Agrobacterium rubi]
MSNLETCYSNLKSAVRDNLLNSLADKLANHTQLPASSLFDLIQLGLTRFDTFHLSIILKEMGHLYHAEALLRQNINLHGDDASELYELALVVLIRDLDQGMELLYRSVKLSSSYENVRLAILLTFFTAKFEMLSFVKLNACPDIVKKVFSENGTFLRYLSAVGPIEVSQGNKGLFDVSTLPLDETTDWFPSLSEGGSLIRLGDGEGAMFRFSEEEEAVLYDLYKNNRDYFAQRWMGSDLDEVVQEDTQAQLLEGVFEFDLVGIPNPSWLMKCFSSGDVRGFSCAWNVLRALVRATPNKKCKFVRTSAFYDFLHRHPLITLFSNEPKITLVSWNDMLPAIIKIDGYCGDINFVRLNPAKSDVDVLFQIDTRLDVTTQDTIIEASVLTSASVSSTIIVAGGYLAKVFSMRWRRDGYRVIDAGSALDMSLGLSIR